MSSFFFFIGAAIEPFRREEENNFLDGGRQAATKRNQRKLQRSGSCRSFQQTETSCDIATCKGTFVTLHNMQAVQSTLHRITS